MHIAILHDAHRQSACPSVGQLYFHRSRFIVTFQLTIDIVNTFRNAFGKAGKGNCFLCFGQIGIVNDSHFSSFAYLTGLVVELMEAGVV